MRAKRLLAALLAAVTLTAALPAAWAASSPSFSDLTALPQVAEAAEFLRLMGVVNGVPGGGYHPSGTLTRAEFCKMAICALDRADEEPAQRSRTIYLDVGPTFWATGYINLASTITLGGGEEGGGGAPLVAGVGDGTFQPNRNITYGEAVTILCRILGYGANDVAAGGTWYDGYLSVGAAAGLTDGLTLNGADVIDRGQAARLFYNLYFSKPKGSDKTYLVSLGGSEVEGGIVLDVNAAADDNSPALKTTKDTYKTARTFDPSLEGQEGKAILDKTGKLLAFVPKEGSTRKVVNITSTEATYLVASGGEKITVEPETVVYREGKATTWAETWANLSASTPVTFHYGPNGKLAYLYFTSASAEGITSMVARTVPASGVNPFAALAGGGSYTMFKNGVAATAADIRQYDVATYDAGTRVIQVSDLKLTGVYEDASPSPAAPVTIKVLGNKDFKVLPSARSDLAAFKIGDKLTLLLTTENQVAGVVSADTVKGDAVGVASVDDKGNATVKLLQGGLEVKGQVSAGAASRYDDQLVSVTNSATGRLSLTVVSGSSSKGSLDVAARKLGDREVSENVAVYDRVTGGKAVEIKYGDLTAATIPQSKIAFVSYDSAGRVKYLVLDDATGDTYEYGYFSYSSAQKVKVDDLSKPIYEKNPDGSNKLDEDGEPILIGYEQHTESVGSPTLAIRQANADGEEITTTGGVFLSSVRNSTPGGVAYNAKGRVAATVSLQPLSGVTRSAFDMEEMTVTVAGVSYPISNSVQCYNKTTKTWFKPGKEGAAAARSYSDDLTVYYDRAPAEGGKIRMIVIP